MKKTEQQPLTALRNQDPHNFMQRYCDWEAAIFDSADYFAAATIRPRRRIEFTDLAEAIAFGSANPGWCLYAISRSGRFIVLDKHKWLEWLERYRLNKEGW